MLSQIVIIYTKRGFIRELHFITFYIYEKTKKKSYESWILAAAPAFDGFWVSQLWVAYLWVLGKHAFDMTEARKVLAKEKKVRNIKKTRKGVVISNYIKSTDD